HRPNPPVPALSPQPTRHGIRQTPLQPPPPPALRSPPLMKLTHSLTTLSSWPLPPKVRVGHAPMRLHPLPTCLWPPPPPPP
ncbi:hypothetical protein AX14_006091, partial [Amanita brunnescens Koide BX004]